MKLRMPSPALVISCLALGIALVPAVHAANTVFSSDIVDGEVKTADLANYSVTNSKIGPYSIGPTKVINNALTLANLRGADTKGSISLSPLANGRCVDVTLVISGAAVGEVPLLALTDPPPQAGLLFIANRVSSAGHVAMSFCNFSGVTSLPISNLGVRVVTFG